MAKLPGLFQRGSVYQLRVVIPVDVKAAYGGKSKLVQSLNTANPREAKLLATQERSRLLEEFENKRLQLSPQRLGTVSPEMASELAPRVRASVLALDDDVRDDPKVSQALDSIDRVVAENARLPLAPLTISGKVPPLPPVPARDAFTGLSEGAATALAGLNDIRNKDAGVRLAQRNLQTVLPLVKEEAHKLGLSFDPLAPGAHEALKAALKAYRQAWQEVAQRDAGDVVETPVVKPISKATARLVFLRDVYGRWKDSKVRSKDSLNTCLRSLILYEELTGNPPITQLTREQGDRFRTWLQQPDRKTTSKTARDRLTWVKALLKYASRDLELIDRNPWEGIDIAFKTTNKRRPWSDAELQTLFTQPIFTDYKLPKDKKAGADAAYWIPLLGLYTGARVGELAQLRVDDVETTGAVPLLSITDEGEGQSVKSEAGVRKVPIHSELIRLGFLNYVAAIKERKEALLWPALAARDGKRGGYFSQWFGVYRKALGFGQYPDFHCMRHTVRSQMADAEVPEQVMDTVAGHEVKGSTGAKVYTHRSLAVLKKAVEVLHYPCLSLSRVFSISGL